MGVPGATQSPASRQVGAAAHRAEAEISQRSGNLYDGPLEWYTKVNRVHLHTRLGIFPGDASTKKWLHPSWLNAPVFLQAGAIARDLGAEVFTRHIVSANEGPWWPSALGEPYPGCENRDLAREIIEEAHKAGRRIIIYYRHFESRWAEQHHPEWIARDAAGKPIQAGRGTWMCLNQEGYRNYVGTHLEELAQRGADGFYFDETHQPPECHCSVCQARPTSRAAILELAFGEWTQRVKAVSPGCLMLVSARFEAEDHRLWRLGDSPKWEPHHTRKYGGPGTTGLRLGLIFARDASGGIPHMWRSTSGPTTKDLTTVQHECAEVLAAGAVYNYDLPEGDWMSPSAATHLQAQRSLALGAKLQPALSGAQPWRETLVFYPAGLSFQAVLPIWNAIGSRGLAAGITTASWLAEGIPPETTLLVLPDCPERTHLLADPKIAAVLADFRKRGGQVVDNPDAAALTAAVEAQEQRASVRLLSHADTVAVQVFRRPSGGWSVTLVSESPQQTVRVRLPAGAAVREAISGVELAATEQGKEREVAIPNLDSIAVLYWQ